MNASDVIRDPQIRARLAMFRPGPPRKVESAIQVLPRSARSGLICNAFDYLLRFDIQDDSMGTIRWGLIATLTEPPEAGKNTSSPVPGKAHVADLAKRLETGCCPQ